MKAIVLLAAGGTDQFRLVDVPTPALRRGDVRIKVKSIAFNPVDCQVRQHLPANGPIGSNILGRDLCGVVEAVHDDVTEFSVGDDVYSYVCKLASSGTYAEYVCVPSELVARKPRQLTHDQAAAVPVAGITAMLALQKCRIDASKSLFVAGGAGGVGTFAIRLALHNGLRRLVTTAGSASSRAHLIQECGLKSDQIVDYRSADFVGESLAINRGAFDAVVDLVGGPMLSAACAILAVEGDLASVVETPTHKDFERLFELNASFHAIGAHAYSLAPDRAYWRRYRSMLTELANLFDDGLLRPPCISHVGSFSVDTVKRAHELLERSAVHGKLVMSGP